MKMQADALTEETVKTFLNQYKFGSNLNDDSLALNIMLSMNDVSLGNLASEVIISLRSVFGISDAQIDVQLISMVSRLIHLVGRDDASKTGKQDLAFAMKSLQSHSNPILKSMALKFLTGVSEQMQPSIQTADMPNDLSAEIQALKQTAAEPLTEQVSPNVPTNVSVASGTSELFDFQAGNNVIQSSDRSARVDARQSLIGLHSESGNSSAHMAAVMNQGEISQVGFVDLNGIPMLVMTPFVAAIIASAATNQYIRNKHKVAIVCDSVACLDGLERTDSIYVVDLNKDLSVESFLSCIKSW